MSERFNNVAYVAALRSFSENRDHPRIKTKDIMVVINMALHSSKKRLRIYDIHTHQVLREHHVAHGSGSAAAYNKGIANKFSNTPMSKCSSKGAMVTGVEYTGRHGKSVRLHGLEPGVNDKVFARSVVFHSATYVTDKFIKDNGRAGLSWGCFAVDPAIWPSLKELIKDGVFVYTFAG
jgi:hypothetical protein